MEIITQNKLTISREIKFRVWNYVKMNYNPTVSDGTDGGETSKVDINIAIFSNEDILMQYTGLTDKNGKEIYEGDVVEAKTVERSPIVPDHISGYLKGVIEYYDNAFCIKYKNKKGQDVYNHLWTNAEDWYVLGNIHEHPHLLEEKQ